MSSRSPLRTSPQTRGAARGAVLAVVAVLALGAGLWVALAPGDAPEPAERPEASDGPMTEAERIAYVKANVTLEGLGIEPDTQPDSDEPVPGLLRVKGEVENRGDRAIDKLVVAIYPRDAAGEVIAAHLDDVLKKGGGLDPGGRREFSFTIPDRGTAEGDFDHELR